MLTAQQKKFFHKEGYLVIHNLLTGGELGYYKHLYDDFLNNKIDCDNLRSDLSGVGKTDSGKEKITQIMTPLKILPELIEKPMHRRTSAIAKELMGGDMALDFDMLINKSPNTNTITPWHQDAAYWIDMPDTRAVSCWMAIDIASKDNGCMWYTPKSHLEEELRPHTQVGNRGALRCDGDEDVSVCVELDSGSCVWHHGRTLHYSRGNTTETDRRAFITNFRPIAMIDLERNQGVDHTGERNVKSTEAK